jgi:ElaB/YqjD/DUF883 family membrane-anchored ribosome-binding protein
MLWIPQRNTNRRRLMTPMDRSSSDSNSSPTGAVTRGVDTASIASHRAIDKAGDAARPAVESLAAGAHHAVDTLGAAAHAAAEVIDHKSGQLHAAQVRLTEGTRGMVRDNPLAAIGVAVAAGFLLSWMLKPRT